jgi:hypothetical protein
MLWAHAHLSAVEWGLHTTAGGGQRSLTDRKEENGDDEEDEMCHQLPIRAAINVKCD